MKWINLSLQVVGALALAFILTLLFLSFLAPWSPAEGITLTDIAAQNLAFIAAAFIAWRWWMKRPWTEMGWTASHPFQAFWKGAGIGAGLIGALALLFLSGAWLSVDAVAWDTKTGYSVAFAITAFLLVAAGEECFTRGFIQPLLIRRLGVAVGIIGTSLLFSALHLANPFLSSLSTVNLFLAGILLGALRVVSGNLWAPIGLHFSWNLTQEMLSLPVSGLQLTPEPPIRIAESGPDWITGGPFGLEGGLGATVFLLIGIAWYVKQMHRRSIRLWSRPTH